MTQPAGKRNDVLAHSYETKSAPGEGLAADLLERISDAFIALDRNWLIVYMNQAAMAMGRPRGPEVIGQSHWDVWPETIGTEVERQYRAAMASQQPSHFEHHYVLPGHDFWHSVHAYPDANGLSIFFRDITEQKRNDEYARLLATTSARLVSTLDQAAIMRVVCETALPALGQWACVYLVDDTFTVTAVDSRAIDVRDAAILRQVVAQLPVTATDMRLPWNRSMHDQKTVLSPADDAFYAALGTAELGDFVAALAPRSLVCVPLVARGRVIGGITFGTGRDGRAHDEHDAFAARELATPTGLALDTARVHEEQLRVIREAEDARRRAEEANTAKLEFLRAMSHELRTPLNAIGGYTQLLLMGARGELPADVRRDLERLERNQLHVSRLINDVLSFTRLEAGRIEFNRALVPLREIMEPLADFVAPQLAQHGGHLRVHACEEDSVVFTDADKARQILLNLISNAFKHTNPGTCVDVYQEAPKRRGDRFVRISVRDDGPGIAPDKLELIFEPFVQVERALNHPVDGLGLGLAIARDLARGMGGDITADSAPDAGATFTLSLPLG